jgi:isopropylmalate/homocitrate/citramalate synthase
VGGSTFSNYLSEAVIHAPLAENLVITDSTLREGQQALRPFTVNEALAIYEVLNKINGSSDVIRSTELFLYTNRDREIVKAVKDSGFKYPKPVAWIRAAKADVDLVVEAGLEEAVMLCSISDIHIRYKLGLTRKDVEKKYLDALEYALKNGLKVRCSLEDATRSDVNFALNFALKAVKLGEKYRLKVGFKLADTLGLGLPFSEAELPRGIPRLVRAFINAGLLGDSLEFHGHNDFGLAVANHLAAWAFGASMSNCTLLGIGERAGNCPLEIVAITYAELVGGDDGMNLKALPEARRVFELMGHTTPRNQPIVGEGTFATKAGIHIDGLLKNPAIYLPFDPLKVVGLPIKIEITPHSGRAGVVYWISTHLQVDCLDLKRDPRVDDIYKEVLAMFEAGRTKPLSDAEMARLVAKHMPEDAYT